MGAIVKGSGFARARFLLYGEHGVGKSTWANQAEADLYRCRRRLDDIGIATARCGFAIGERLYAECLFFAEGRHDYKTICIDTLRLGGVLLHKMIVDRRTTARSSR